MLDRGNMEPSGSLEKESGIEMPTAEKIKIPESAEDLLKKENHNKEIKAKLTETYIGELKGSIPKIEEVCRRAGFDIAGNITEVKNKILALEKELPTEKKTDIETKEKENQEKPTDRDSLLKSIEKELIEDWEKTNGKEILSAEGQDFLFGSQKDPTTIAQKAEKVFAKRYPEEAKKHETAEKTKIYDNPEDDPVVEKMRKEIRRIANKDIEEAMNGGLGSSEIKKDYEKFVHSTNSRVAMQQWEIFKTQYPEKASAYQEKIGPEGELSDKGKKPASDDKVSTEEPEKLGTNIEEEIIPDEVYSKEKESEGDDGGTSVKTPLENASQSQNEDDKKGKVEDKDNKNKEENKDKPEKLGELPPKERESEGNKNKVVEKTETIPRNKNEKKVESLEESARLLKEKIRDSKFCENIKRLVNKLEKNSMVDSRAVIFLDRAVKGMEDAIKEDSMVSLKDINSYIEKVWGGINALPKDPKDIENANDAREVADILENIGQSSSEIKIELGESKDKNLEESTDYFGALNKLIEKKRGILLDKTK